MPDQSEPSRRRRGAKPLGLPTPSEVMGLPTAQDLARMASVGTLTKPVMPDPTAEIRTALARLTAHNSGFTGGAVARGVLERQIASNARSWHEFVREAERSKADAARSLSALQNLSDGLARALADVPRPDASRLKLALQVASETDEAYEVAAAAVQAVDSAERTSDVIGAPIFEEDDEPPGLRPADESPPEPVQIRFSPEDIELLRDIAQSQAAPAQEAVAKGTLDAWVTEHPGQAWLVQLLVTILVSAVLQGVSVARDYYGWEEGPEEAATSAPREAVEPRTEIPVCDLPEDVLRVDRGSTD